MKARRATWALRRTSSAIRLCYLHSVAIGILDERRHAGAVLHRPSRPHDRHASHCQRLAEPIDVLDVDGKVSVSVTMLVLLSLSQLWVSSMAGNSSRIEAQGAIESAMIDLAGLF
jgi:hypothetical protein